MKKPDIYVLTESEVPDLATQMRDELTSYDLDTNGANLLTDVERERLLGLVDRIRDRASGLLLPPSIQAQALAKYSRSPASARDVVRALTAEGANRFHDKNTIGYGHSSVAELATIPICFEGVSIVASKFLEGYQRAGYSEKSTRYQSFSVDSFVEPYAPATAPGQIRDVVRPLYAAYDAILPRLAERLAGIMDLPADDRRVRARAFDSVRYLLPAGTGTSLGGVYNLRDVRYLIQDALGHPNPEIRAIGQATYTAVAEHCPALVREPQADTFEPRVRSLGPVSAQYNPQDPSWYVAWWQGGTFSELEDRFIALVHSLHGMTWPEFAARMETRGARGVPKVFRTIRVAYDVLMDYGAYRDLQRHRRCEQYSELLTGEYGYLVPDDIEGTELEDEYRAAIDPIVDDGSVWRGDYGDHAAQYVLPLACLHRTAFVMDLAEVYYIGELRTQPQCHISYRRVAWRMVEMARQAYPRLMAWCRAIEPKAIGVHT